MLEVKPGAGRQAGGQDVNVRTILVVTAVLAGGGQAWAADCLDWTGFRNSFAFVVNTCDQATAGEVSIIKDGTVVSTQTYHLNRRSRRKIFFPGDDIELREIGWQAGTATDARGDIEITAHRTSETFTNYLVRNRSGRHVAIRVMVNRAGGAGVKPLVFFVDYVLKPHAFDGVFQTNAQYGETYYLEWAVYDPVSPETNEARLPRTFRAH